MWLLDDDDETDDISLDDELLDAGFFEPLEKAIIHVIIRC